MNTQSRDRIRELIAECDAKNVCPLGLALIRQRSATGDGWSDWRHSYPVSDDAHVWLGIDRDIALSIIGAWGGFPGAPRGHESERAIQIAIEAGVLA